VERPITRKGSPKTKFNTPLSWEEELNFQKWKQRYAPYDSGEDYDLRGAFLAGQTADQQKGEHGKDTWKKPNHPTFSDESQYAGFGNPGKWLDQGGYVPFGGLLQNHLKEQILGAQTPQPVAQESYLINLLRKMGLSK